jgi:hypothetical protein
MRTSTMLSFVGISRPWTAACGMTAGFPSAAGMLWSRVWVPLSAPFSTAKVLGNGGLVVRGGHGGDEHESENGESRVHRSSCNPED